MSSLNWSNLLNFSFAKNVPVIYQAEQSECGLACLAMISGYYGKSTSLHELRTAFPQSGRGSRLADLIQVGSSMGLAARPVKVELADISQLSLPCILHWKMKHFVVLTGVSSRSLTVIDPKRGIQQVSMKDADEYFTGVALELDKGADFKKDERQTKVSLVSLLKSVKGLGKGAAQVLCLAAVLEIFTLLAPQHLRMVMDQVVPLQDTGLLTFLGVSFTLVLIIRATIELMRRWILVWLGANMNIGWTGNVFSHTLQLPLDYFRRRGLGDVVSRFSAINVIQQTLTANFVLALVDGLTALILLGVLFYYDTNLCLIVFGFSLAYFTARFSYLTKYHAVVATQVNVGAVQQGELIEALRGMQAIRLNGAESHRLGKYMNATADVANMSVRFQRLEMFFEALGTTITGGQRVAVIWVGCLAVLKGTMTPGSLVAFVLYADLFAARFVNLANYWVQLRLLSVQVDRVSDIMFTPRERFVTGRGAPVAEAVSVRFDSVSFSYGPDQPSVVKACDFNIEPGEVLAISGPSGVGKSTIAKLLLGIQDYESGAIYVGGSDLRLIGKRRVRELSASVLQEDHLFIGTIADNISLFTPEATLEDVRAAAVQANIAAEIEAMPMGYLTQISDLGNSLSGGQQQRVLLARAFFRKPKLLVLDEATSSLDLESERLICEAVRNCGITTLIIAHRPQTLASADRVLFMKDGALLEKPKHHALSA